MLLTKVHFVKAMVFAVVIIYGCELDHEESWTQKSWCFGAVVLKNTLESPLDCKKIKPVNSKENQSWIFIRRTDAEAPIFWPPDTKGWLLRKDPDAGKDWRQEEKGTTEDDERLCWAVKDAGILGLRRRGIQSGASDKAWLLRAFVW